jgi:hypothetical protein
MIGGERPDITTRWRASLEIRSAECRELPQGLGDLLYAKQRHWLWHWVGSGRVGEISCDPKVLDFHIDCAGLSASRLGHRSAPE